MADESGATIDKPEGHPYLRLTRTLEENNVLTIEPGMYFIDMLLDEARGDHRKDMINWDRLAELHAYGGIRIEDDVRVTTDGRENLTRDAYAI
jgi:Xaa-Pro dipeptidase